MSREGESELLNKIFETKGISKVACSTHAIVRSKMTLHQARVARRSGSLIKIAGKKDLYQDVKTNDFWKISEDKQHIERVFEENDIVA